MFHFESMRTRALLYRPWKGDCAPPPDEGSTLASNFMMLTGIEHLDILVMIGTIGSTMSTSEHALQQNVLPRASVVIGHSSKECFGKGLKVQTTNKCHIRMNEHDRQSLRMNRRVTANEPNIDEARPRLNTKARTTTDQRNA